MMKKFVVFAAVLCLSATALAAQTEQERFENLLKKHSTLDVERAKFLCLCQGSAESPVGIIVRHFDEADDDFILLCAVPTFNPDGSIKGEGSCPQPWVPLGK